MSRKLAVGDSYGLVSLLTLGNTTKPIHLQHPSNKPVTYVDWARHRNSILATSPSGICLWTLQSHKTRTASFFSSHLNFLLDSKDGVVCDARGRLLSQVGANATRKLSITNRPVEEDFAFAKFHAQDSIFHAVIKSSLVLYSYKLSDPGQDIIDKCHASNWCRKIAVFKSPVPAHRITATASANIFYSYLLFFASSNKSLSVLDLNVGDYVWRIDDLEDRSVSAIALNQGSLFCNSVDYSQFATYSSGLGVQVWDLRSDPNTAGPTYSLACNEDTANSSSFSAVSQSLS
ncbi:Signal-induced proliferation-associated 1-like protein 2 [Cichlidogyrus casuarinus]|uniref:Signal-induced proliferation-associated 1-like protein 2 n=1 Tax=Cichlidogyrus casuarinus TaxID=1844966 RepID=A0ABD2PZC1_9PLAT